MPLFHQQGGPGELRKEFHRFDKPLNVVRVTADELADLERRQVHVLGLLQLPQGPKVGRYVSADKTPREVGRDAEEPLVHVTHRAVDCMPHAIAQVWASNLPASDLGEPLPSTHRDALGPLDLLSGCGLDLFEVESDAVVIVEVLYRGLRHPRRGAANNAKETLRLVEEAVSGLQLPCVDPGQFPDVVHQPRKAARAPAGEHAEDAA